MCELDGNARVHKEYMNESILYLNERDLENMKVMKVIKKPWCKYYKNLSWNLNPYKYYTLKLQI